MKKLMTGDEAVAQGVYEAGVSFASAYPGTPSTEILENVSTYKEIYSEWAPNEKVAMEAAIGASISGVRSFAAMKHVGVNVAADPLLTFAYMGTNGGMVFVSADDPGMYSSQNEQDNRNYAKFAKIAMFEPSDSQESLDMVKEAYHVSEEYDLIVMLRMTTRICHSKSLVEISDRTEVPVVPYVKNQLKFEAIPAIAKKLRIAMVDREAKLKAYSESTIFNREEWHTDEIGIVTAGISYQYAKEVFGNDASYLKIGFTFPLPLEKIRAFSKKVKKLYVIEELDPFMEEQIKTAGIACIGRDLIPGIDELNPDIIRKALLGTCGERQEMPAEYVVPRPPALCAGCPHRGFFYELKQRKETVIVGDIGCYGLGGSAPLNAIDIGLDMGSAFSLAHGIKKGFDHSGQTKHVVGVVGDSTFFHTGINGLIEASYNHSNIVCAILDNRITGMTGHQENPGTGYRIDGLPTTLIDIETVVRAVGIQHVKTVNPLDLKEMSEALDWAFSIENDPSVIITKWPCVLKKFSDEDRQQFDLNRTVCIVDQAKCIGCKKCLGTGCPALRFNSETKKTSIGTGCVGCMICVQVCPVKAIGKKGE